MAIVSFTGFENGGDSADGIATVTGGSFSSSIKRTGAYSARVNAVGAGEATCISLFYSSAGVASNVTSIVDTYVQFYFYVATLPASANEPIFRAVGITDQKLEIRITSAGKLQIYDTSNAQIGSDGATTLSTGVWYQIRAYFGTGATADYEVQIDGSTEFSGTASSSANNTSAITYGKGSNKNSQTVDFYYDDIVVDDASFPTFALEVKALDVDGNGSTMSWTSGTGSSDYTQVNEVPPSDTEYVMSPTTGNPNVALFSMESVSSAGISFDDIFAFQFATKTRENTSVSSASFLRIKSSSTSSDSSTLNGTTSISNRGILALVDPNTSSAWTESGLNALEIGVVENNNVSTRATFMRGMVLYSPSTSVASTGNFLLLM